MHTKGVPPGAVLLSIALLKTEGPSPRPPPPGRSLTPYRTAPGTLCPVLSRFCIHVGAPRSLVTGTCLFLALVLSPATHSRQFPGDWRENYPQAAGPVFPACVCSAHPFPATQPGSACSSRPRQLLPRAACDSVLHVWTQLPAWPCLLRDSVTSWPLSHLWESGAWLRRAPSRVQTPASAQQRPLLERRSFSCLSLQPAISSVPRPCG